MARQLTVEPTKNTAVVRILLAKEQQLLFEHLMRLSRESRHDRFNGYVDDAFLERYVASSVADGTVIFAYVVDGIVRGAAEMHQPDLTPGSLPEIAFSVEAEYRRLGVGSKLFDALISTARAMRYKRLRITTGGYNDAMRALAVKFGAKLVFRHGESSGDIDIEDHTPHVAEPKVAVKSRAKSWFEVQGALMDYTSAYWRVGPSIVQR